MAKKVVVSGNNVKGKSKKKKVCLTCFLVFVIVNLVLFAGIFGAGWYFGDMYAKEYLDMSLSDIFGVTNGLYWANDKKVVKNDGFTDEDRNGFYDEIKKNLLLKTDAEVDFDAELLRAIDAVFEQNTESDAANTVSRLNDAEPGEPGEPGEPSEPGEPVEGEGGESNELMNILTNMMTGVFTRDNIDVERLQNYTEENDDYVFNIKDKQLASFVGFLINSVLKDNTRLTALLPSDVEIPDLFLEALSGELNFNDVIALKAIKIGTQTVTTELGESTLKANCADVTVWLGLQDTVGRVLSVLTEQYGYGWANGLVKFAANIVLPKNVYATITLPLDDNAKTYVSLNGMSTAKRDNMYKLIDNVMALVGADEQGESGFVEGMLASLGDAIKPYIAAAADSIDFGSVSEGTVKIDLLGTLTEFASESMGTEDPLTKPELMTMLQALLTSSADARLEQLQPYLYDKWYRNASGTEAYDPADKSGFVKIDYEREFIDEIENKYCLDFGEDAKLADVLAKLGISLDGSPSTGEAQDVLDMVNAAKFKESLDKNINELKLNVTDRMLAAGISPQLDKAFAGGEMSDLKLTLDALTFVERADAPGHTFAMLAVDIDVTQMLGALGDNMLGTLAMNIMPQKILVSMFVDITLSLPSGQDYALAEFMFNDFEKTSNVLATLKKLVPSFDVQSMTEQVEQLLRDMMTQLDSTLGLELVPSVETGSVVGSGKLVLPNIYKLVSVMALKDETTGEPVLTDVELKDVLRGLNNTDGIDDSSNIADDNSEFISQISEKFYLNPATELMTFADVTDFLGGEFTSDKFRLSGSDPDVRYLVYDDTPTSELEPEITNAQLGALIEANMTGETANYEILRVNVHPSSLDIVLKIDIRKLLDGNKLASLIDAEAMYVTARVDMSTDNGHDYPVSFSLNKMSEKQFGDMVKLAKFFDPSFDIESQVGEVGKIMYDQMQNLKTSLGGDGFVKFEEGKVKIASIYKFLAVKMELENSDEETVRKAIQGMYEKTAVFGDNPNNYAADDFVVNRGATGGYNASDLASGMSDVKFNAFFADMVKNKITSDGSVTAVQTTALPNSAAMLTASPSVKAKADAVRAWADGKLKTTSNSVIADSSDYLVVTFAMNLNKGAVAGATSFMPDVVYVTVVLEKKLDGSFANKGVIFNDMDAATYEVLTGLMSLDSSATDGDKVNITSIVNQCVEDLNELNATGGDYATISFEPSADDGIGAIKGTLKIGA